MEDAKRQLQDRIFKALEKIPPHIQVCAAAKLREVWEIESAIECGISHIGMNYVQETKEKKPTVLGTASWSFLGKLQSNKISGIVPLFDTIESVDDLEKLILLSKYCNKFKKKIRVLIEINIAKEPQKSGIFPEHLEDFVSEMEGANFHQIHTEGLMTMGPSTASKKEYETMFTAMRCLFEKKKSWSTLSMGMSDTWEIAVACGATRVRLGTVLFGERTISPSKIVPI